MVVFHDVFGGDYAVLELFAYFMRQVRVRLVILYVLNCLGAKDLGNIGGRG